MRSPYRMKQTLQLKLSQHLTLTPQLQQSIRLLQLSTLELNAEVERMLQENPLLEREEGEDEPPPQEFPLASTAAGPGHHRARRRATTTATATRRHDRRRRRRRRATTCRTSPTSATTAAADRRRLGRRQHATRTTTSRRSRSPSSSLRDHLMEQLALLNLPLRDRQLVAALIDALDDDGYLTSSLEEIAEMFSEDDRARARGAARSALKLPAELRAGGRRRARSRPNASALQLKALPDDTPFRAEALKIVDGHLPLLAARDFTKLQPRAALRRGVRARRARADPQPEPAAGRVVRQATRRTTSFPTSSYARCAASGWRRSTRRRCRSCASTASTPTSCTRNRESSNQQLAAQLQEAKWLIRNVQQRFETILRVAQAIVERQRHFFEHGEVAMRPMVLREIADMLDLHESTISRVTTQKYMLTPRGTFELKYFFGSHVATDTGGAASATAIRALIKQLVAAENPQTPLTDSRIAELLGEQGIIVARRTIAKYREALQIPPVNLRKAPVGAEFAKAKTHRAT